MSQMDGQTLNVNFIDEIQKFLNQSNQFKLKDIGSTFLLPIFFQSNMKI